MIFWYTMEAMVLRATMGLGNCHTGDGGITFLGIENAAIERGLADHVSPFDEGGCMLVGGYRYLHGFPDEMAWQFIWLCKREAVS